MKKVKQCSAKAGFFAVTLSYSDVIHVWCKMHCVIITRSSILVQEWGKMSRKKLITMVNDFVDDIKRMGGLFIRTLKLMPWYNILLIFNYPNSSLSSLLLRLELRPTLKFVWFKMHTVELSETRSCYLFSKSLK